MILGTLVYIFSPINFATEFIPVIGLLDDVVLLTLMVSEVSQLLIDSAKSRKAETVASNTGDTTEKTVDVDAVSVQ
jgi:uncharacterized membrane protein YkvA (DUF1232 family)